MGHGSIGIEDQRPIVVPRLWQLLPFQHLSGPHVLVDASIEARIRPAWSQWSGDEQGNLAIMGLERGRRGMDDLGGVEGVPGPLCFG